MKPTLEKATPATPTNGTSSPCSSRTDVEFDTSTEGKIVVEIPQNPWKWTQIQPLLDEVLSSTTKRGTTDSNTRKALVESLAKKLYPYLPDARGELKTIRTNALQYIQLAHRGGKPEAKRVLRPYVLQLKALVLAVRQKLAVIYCQPNCRNWDKRAYRFYAELQQNLATLRRAHFLTLTFTRNPTYKRVRELLRDVTCNQLYRQAFESVEVVAFHPEERMIGRLHVHLLIWSKQNRSLRDEKSAIERFRTAVGRNERGIGFTHYRPVLGIAEILDVSAYMAWNYDRTLKQAKGPDNPIPKGARVLSRPQNFLPGQAWTSTGKITLVTPATTAWRKAVSKYAAAHGRSPAGDRRWIWRERRNIRKFLEPESWWDVSVAGLDGYTYRVKPEEVDCEGNEIYLATGEDGHSFYPTEETLEQLAKLQVVSWVLPKNDQLDFTTGKTAFWNEMLGMHAFM